MSTTDDSKAWKKADDIPRRFDELPPETDDWVPVADVIRTHREETAKQEAKLIKIKPPVDSDSESSESEVKTQPAPKKVPLKKEEKKDVHIEKQRIQPKPKQVDASFDESVYSSRGGVDDVTKAMLNWGLNSDYYPRRKQWDHLHGQDRRYSLPDKQLISQVQDRWVQDRETRDYYSRRASLGANHPKHNFKMHEDYKKHPGMASGPSARHQDQRGLDYNRGQRGHDAPQSGHTKSLEYTRERLDHQEYSRYYMKPNSSFYEDEEYLVHGREDHHHRQNLEDDGHHQRGGPGYGARDQPQGKHFHFSESYDAHPQAPSQDHREAQQHSPYYGESSRQPPQQHHHHNTDSHYGPESEHVSHSGREPPRGYDTLY